MTIIYAHYFLSSNDSVSFNQNRPTVGKLGSDLIVKKSIPPYMVVDQIAIIQAAEDIQREPAQPPITFLGTPLHCSVI